MPNDYEPFRLVRHPIDFANLGRQLLPHIERIVRRFDPRARLSGTEMWFADPGKREGDQDRASASINVSTGAWHARSSGKGGHDVISLVAYMTSPNTQAEAARIAADMAGISIPDLDQAEKPTPHSCSRRDFERDFSDNPRGVRGDEGCNGHEVIEADSNRKVERDRASARQLLSENPVPVADTLGEVYFRSRGLVEMPSITEARFAPALPYRDGDFCKGSYPAILLPMTYAVTGEVSSVLRIYLAPDGSGKLDLKDDDGRKLSPKKVLGRYGGCAMWFAGIPGELGEEIILCEGPEDALSIRMATGQTAVAAGSCHQLEKVAIPAGVKRIVIVPDDNSDPEDPTKVNVGEKGLQCAARKFRAAGIEVFVARIPDRKDANAVLCDEGPDGGAEGLRRIIERRVPYSAPISRTRLATSPRRIGASQT